jgi:hypothetical protein
MPSKLPLEGPLFLDSIFALHSLLDFVVYSGGYLTIIYQYRDYIWRWIL